MRVSIMPDHENKEILVRNPNSTRPWQHVLEPLSGYIKLAEKISETQTKSVEENHQFCNAFNFGPKLESNKKVKDLVNEIIKNWEGNWVHIKSDNELYEARKLNLEVEKAYQLLGWSSKWNFQITVKKTIDWYKNFIKNPNIAYELCKKDINEYMKID